MLQKHAYLDFFHSLQYTLQNLPILVLELISYTGISVNYILVLVLISYTGISVNYSH